MALFVCSPPNLIDAGQGETTNLEVNLRCKKVNVNYFPNLAILLESIVKSKGVNQGTGGKGGYLDQLKKLTNKIGKLDHYLHFGCEAIILS
ncbi:hypothetical protein Tcan_02975 [Toxocara canis]|uniref:Uncharacterized protein n=1 Tax=Toxocara canis TaxID=6265 RepID=A0A0B2VUN4_TOXCA|nr:hypothetical protein Tcan_02975 [Toxocara canis]